jgi:hypothetical protein
LHSLSSVFGLAFPAGTRIEAHGLPAYSEAILRDSLWICKPEVGKRARIAVERALAGVKRLIRRPIFAGGSFLDQSPRFPQFIGHRAIVKLKDLMNAS